MDKGYFNFIPNPDKESEAKKLLVFKYPDGKTSDPITSFETADGETYSLVPHAVDPWFLLVDTGGTSMFGRAYNYYGIDPTTSQHTSPILSVTTEKGETINTFPLMVPDKEPAHKSVSFEELGKILSDHLRNAAQEGPISAYDDPEDEPTPPPSSPSTPQP